jgi:lipid II:glycine glycyltransferase (peptidoglycan interpeptide bridge formation enzyme)
LIAWSKRLGARWFDFGGVPLPTEKNESDQPLSGITDFKRFFCDQITEVGEDWILEPRPIRALIARAVRTAATQARTSVESFRKVADGVPTTQSNAVPIGR